MQNKIRHGGRILADQLSIQGCEKVFCVPGESFLAVLDGLHDIAHIQTIVCRQEGGAAMMAEAWGKLTGQPGICFVTRGPGASNAAAGVHVAHQDSTPMILFIGQVGSGMQDREAFQEIDYRRMFGQMAKWVAQIDSVERIPEYLSRAYHLATAGRPGPVVLALPEDMLSSSAQVIDSKPALAVRAHASDKDLDYCVSLLAAAKKPLIIVGGGGWDGAAKAHLEIFARDNMLPVATSFRCQDYFDNRHVMYAGHVGIGIDKKLAVSVKDCDLLLCIGARLGEMTTSGFSLLDIPNPQQTFIHVYAGSEELGRIYRPDLPINAASPSFMAALSKKNIANKATRQNWAQTANADYHDSLKLLKTPGELKLEQVIAYLNRQLDDDAIICNGAGNYTAWVHKYYQYKNYKTQLAPTSGSMGYGLPAAIAAKIKHPSRTVICFAGDGCFLMTGQELATGVAHKLGIIILLANNDKYGTIRMHQERDYPGRVYATDLVNPDFAAYANSFGARGIKAANQQEFEQAFQAALNYKGPSLIELPLDAEALTPAMTLEQIKRGAN